MNISDSEMISGMIAASGGTETLSPEEADIILVNTCTVRNSADTRAQARISRFKPYKKKKPSLLIIVCGCMAQRMGDGLLKKMPFIDAVVGTDQYSLIPDIVREHKGGNYSLLGQKSDYEGMSKIRGSGVNAWVTVMRGCNNFCSYCIVPHVRGREHSRSPEKIIAEINEAVENGYTEITLLGQNVNSYKSDRFDFPALLEKINAVDGLRRIRFLTSHPKDMSDRLIDCFRNLEKLCPGIHLPVQSGSDVILGRMNRGYTVSRYLGLVDKLRKACPDIGITTDVIAGFPGETENDFEKTMLLFEKVRYDAAFTFIYSPRSGTAASVMRDDVPRHIKAERLNRLINLQMRITKEINDSFTGKTEDVLVESVSPRSPEEVTGRTGNFHNVVFKGEKDLVGRIVPIEILSSSGWALRGRHIK